MNPIVPAAVQAADKLNVPAWAWLALGIEHLILIALVSLAAVLIYRANIKDLSRFFENIDDTARKADVVAKDLATKAMEAAKNAAATKAAADAYNKVINGGK
jgi:hypothetical protein